MLNCMAAWIWWNNYIISFFGCVVRYYIYCRNYTLLHYAGLRSSMRYIYLHTEVRFTLFPVRAVRVPGHSTSHTWLFNIIFQFILFNTGKLYSAAAADTHNNTVHRRIYAGACLQRARLSRNHFCPCNADQFVHWKLRNTRIIFYSTNPWSHMHQFLHFPNLFTFCVQRSLLFSPFTPMSNYNSIRLGHLNRRQIYSAKVLPCFFSAVPLNWSVRVCASFKLKNINAEDYGVINDFGIKWGWAKRK